MPQGSMTGLVPSLQTDASGIPYAPGPVPFQQGMVPVVDPFRPAIIVGWRMAASPNPIYPVARKAKAKITVRQSPSFRTVSGVLAWRVACCMPAL